MGSINAIASTSDITRLIRFFLLVCIIVRHLLSIFDLFLKSRPFSSAFQGFFTRFYGRYIGHLLCISHRLCGFPAFAGIRSWLVLPC
jgi:hypothetical protein